MVGLRKKIRIGDMLLEAGVITEQELQRGLELQKGSGRKLGETLVDEGIVNDEVFAKLLAEQLGMEMVDASNIMIPENVLSLVPQHMLRSKKMLPYAIDPDNMNVLHVAMADPMDFSAMDDISIITNLQVEPSIATQHSIMLALDRLYGGSDVDEALEEYAKEREKKEDVQEELLNENINSSPIVVLVNEMIEKAVRQRASDIHIEALERKVRIRYRIDGALYERASYSPAILPALIARIKIIGGMDIAEKRKPQDGRITYVVDRMEYDIRVSILPTVYGEKVVMRLTSKTALSRNKSQLGLKENELKQFDHIMRNPHGIILVTGPTGSGKSTTLYTALSELNTEDVNIITVEDPVEANINGINQVQVNNKAELTFASALRSILRQDPDIIMIGEIRDTETAGIAVQASITGHLVVSTLHTNSAAGSVTRLIDMGIAPYLIADSVVGIIAQRLVRRLCPECKKPHEATEEEKEQLMVPKDRAVTIYEPCGCPKCDNTGYKGRIGVYEILEMSQKLKNIVVKNGNAEDIRNQALAEGMHTLHMSAAEYVLDGITSYHEMMKVSFDL